MSTGAVIGFVVTVAALTAFMVVSYWQLVRIRRTSRGELEVGGDSSEPPDSAPHGESR